jgi:hypothetical protein
MVLLSAIFRLSRLFVWELTASAEALISRSKRFLRKAILEVLINAKIVTYYSCSLFAKKNR